MYEAYGADEVVSKLPFHTSCIASYNKTDKLFIGSKPGHLLCCQRRTDGQRYFDFQVIRNFAKRAVVELKIVESHDLILCLTTETQLTVHSVVEPFGVLDSCNKYRPITSFAYFVEQKHNTLWLAVCARKRIHIFKWFKESRSFDEAETLAPLNLPDNVRAMCWSGASSLIVALRNEFNFMKVFINPNDLLERKEEVGKLRLLIRMGMLLIESPLLLDIPARGWTALRCDNSVALVDENGVYLDDCQFSDTPVALAYDEPYLLAVLAKGIVEIRVLKSSSLIQKVVLEGAATICSGNAGEVYVGSERSSWLLNSKPLIRQNVKFLVDVKQFELAVILAKKFPDLVDTSCLVETYRCHAHALFLNKKFVECFNNHLEIKTDVLLVLNFLPDLIPEQYNNSLGKYSALELSFFCVDKNFLSNGDLKLAILALSVYLAAKRTEYAQMLSVHYKNFHADRKENLLPTKVLKKYEEILKLVDTVLLKCYIKTKQSLVPSLLRLPDNSCIISEAEKDLNSAGKYAELLILYERKRFHRKALELLKRESKLNESPLFGLDSMVEYLHNLLGVDMKLVFEYASHVLKEDPTLGIQIFTGPPDSSEGLVSKLDHEEILQFLDKHCDGDIIITYLEHIIFRLYEQRPKFHDMLANCYLSKVKTLMKDYVHTLADDELRTRGGEEEGELGAIRTKFMRFLEFSSIYGAEELLTKLDDFFLEEKAILYGRLKEHDKAFSIYANILMNFSAAEQHCALYYDAEDPINSQVYFKLFKAYTTPLDLNDCEFRPKFMQQPAQPNMVEALKILRKYSAKIDIVKAIEEIPMDANLKQVWEPLEAAFETTKSQTSTMSMLLSLSRQALKKSEKKLREISAQKIRIDALTECVLCRKKIADSAFVCYPNKSIAHFFCYKKVDSKQKLDTK